MKLIKPYYEIIEPTGYTIEDVYKSIELAGKVSHKSEHTIKEGSAKEFVDRIINWGHNSCLEFGTVYLTIPWNTEEGCLYCEKYVENPYSKVVDSPSLKCSYITTNYRVILENKWEDHLKWLCIPTEEHIKRYCVKFVCNRSISHEFVRHRKFSFMQESQRYCRYSSNKFNNEITFIEPCWAENIDMFKEYPWITAEYLYDYSEQEKNISASATLFDQLERAEKSYLDLIERGWKPEQAREVLPNATKTELYMCGFSVDWEDFLRNRSNKYGKGGAHPSASELTDPLYEEFMLKGYINSIE